jgi:lipopolysaccharide/colanic/teichoic acid biosynthesis glycosyltransferase
VKRALDLAVSLPALLLFGPFLAGVALLVKATSKGPALFRQERVGRGFRPFTIYKFRTMVEDAPRRGRTITAGPDPRITPLGGFLRRWKIDELPQLYNVLRGDMSLVGPRPEVPRYVEMFRDEYREILRVRPGITDLASLKYRNESDLLGAAADPEAEYVLRLLPDKIALAKDYVARGSLATDCGVILRTFAALLPFGRSPDRRRSTGRE